MFTAQRKESWTADLTRYINASLEAGSNLVLDWTNRSCATWVADAIVEMTGEDPLAAFRGCASATAYGRVLLGLGHNNVASYISSILEEEPNLMMAQRGDVCLVPIRASAVEETPQELRTSIALADPPIYWVLTSSGLARGNLLEAFEAFRVGRPA
jgi:hypothetical protein